MNFIVEEQDITKLIVSSVIGAAIGLEREYKGKTAGFKTLMFICLGSTLFTIFSIKLGTDSSHDRIAANIITGIGFLGAGAIFRDRENMITGLTTATIIWVLAALGMGVGVGEYLFAITSAILILLLLVSVPLLEKLIDGNHEVRPITISVASTQKFDEIRDQMQSSGLKMKKIRLKKSGNLIIINAIIIGKAKAVHDFTTLLLNDSEVAGVDL
jgi:putative Mg2+ transporter-C (MgtC) family protein